MQDKIELSIAFGAGLISFYLSPFAIETWFLYISGKL